jgi:hypothetical protein
MLTSNADLFGQLEPIAAEALTSTDPTIRHVGIVLACVLGALAPPTDTELLAHLAWHAGMICKQGGKIPPEFSMVVEFPNE